MKKKDIKILIVEDDISFGKTLKEEISKAGYEAILVSNPKEALYNYKMVFINAFIIDCLLPQMSGIELASLFREKGTNQQPMFFISGVFKEDSFFDEVRQKTNATAFFQKPFSVSSLIKRLDKHFEDKIKPKKDFIYHAIAAPYLSHKERLSIVANIKKLHGFTLPQIIKLLLFPKISGILKLKSSTTKKESYIYFLNGKVTSIRMISQKPQSFFGEILINKNLLSFEELKPFLSKNEAGQAKIGEKLVQENLISPHIINIIVKEQIGIRLSQLISDVYYEVAFEEASIKDKAQAALLNNKTLKRIYAKCFTAKLPVSYIKNIYLDKLNYSIQFTSDFSASIFQIPIFKKTEQIFTSIKDNDYTLISLLNKYPKLGKELYLGMHLLSTINMIYLKPTQSEEASQMKVLRLKKIVNDIKDQDHFEVLNISKKANTLDIRQAYKKLSIIFHPNVANTQKSAEAEALIKTIFNKINTAYEVLSDEKKRSAYELSLEHTDIKGTLQSEHLFEEGKQALYSNNKRTALDLLQKAVDIHTNPPPNLQLYLIWAKLLNVSVSNESIDSKMYDIQTSFDKISAENRNTPLFYLVRGLFYKHSRDDKEAAVRNFQYACYLDPNLNEAKKQLKLMSYDVSKKPVSIFQSDLKDVIKSIPSLFKRKSG